MSIERNQEQLYRAIDIAYSSTAPQQRGLDYYDDYLPALHEIQTFSSDRADEITLEITGVVEWDNGVEEAIRKGIRQGFRWAVAESACIEKELSCPSDPTLDLINSEYILHGPSSAGYRHEWGRA